MTVKPKAGWPKDRVHEAFDAKGKKAAYELGDKLGLANHRLVRWIEREWVSKGKGKTAPKKKPVAKKKATAPAGE